LSELFLEPFDFDYIKQKAKRFIFIHSDDDPYCPLEHAQYLCKMTNGKLILQKGQQHFSTSTAGDNYKEFPFLLDMIVNN
jgi:predicted alpha/beta hydrolase family esterase